MAMATWLQMVTEDELRALKAAPTTINKLDKPGGESFSTHYFCSISYFVTGDAWGGDAEKNPLAGMLFGFESIDCSTLENGNFGVVTPAQVALVIAKLEVIDLDTVKAKIDDADPDELEEDEVEDFELLLEDDEPASEVLVDEIKRLTTFYKAAAENRRGIVMYTT